jgi:hypothetical protein
MENEPIENGDALRAYNERFQDMPKPNRAERRKAIRKLVKQLLRKPKK